MKHFKILLLVAILVGSVAAHAAQPTFGFTANTFINEWSSTLLWGLTNEVSANRAVYPLRVDSDGHLKVDVMTMEVYKLDDHPFTVNVDEVLPVAGMFDDTSPDSVDEGDCGIPRMSANRNLYFNVRDAAGNERGANVNASNELHVEAHQATHDDLNCNANVQMGDVGVADGAELYVRTGSSLFSAEVAQGTHDDLNANANIQVGNADVANGNPVPVSDAGGSLTIDNATLSVTGGGVEASALRVTVANDSTGLLSVDDNGGSLTVDNAYIEQAQMNMKFAFSSEATAVAGMRTVLMGGDDGTNLKNIAVDSNGYLQCDVITMPGGLTGYAEDSVHNSGDIGIMPLGVRLDARATMASNSGDYTTWQATSNGDMRVRDDDANTDLDTIAGTVSGSEQQVDIVAEIPAGTQTIGSVKITDGSETADVDNGASYDGLMVRITDGTNLCSISGTGDLEVSGNAGAALATEATLSTIDADTSSLAGTVAGSEQQVDIVAELPAGTQNIGDVDVLTMPQVSTALATHYNLVCTLADTEYSQAFTNAESITFQNQGNEDIRYAFVTGKVATPTAPYMTLKAGAVFNKDNLNVASGTLYFASGVAGQTVEIEVW